MIFFVDNRYVKAGGNNQQYTFNVPYIGCGSKPSCAVCDSVDNVLIIQSDEEVQVCQIFNFIMSS